jgi:serine protease Do
MRKLLIGSLLLGGILIGLGVGHFFNEQRSQYPIPTVAPISYTSPYSLEEAIVRVVEEVKPAVVNLSIEKTVRGIGPFRFEWHWDWDSPLDDFFRRFFEDFEREYRTRSLGTGVIIDSRGYILTNHHVVKGADIIKVKLFDGRKFRGRVVGQDSKTDIALIKIDAKQLPVAKLGDSDKVRIGSWVIAIGNPFGLEHTVTVGVISGKGRAIGATAYEDFIQTDASINPGNSGGPLVNLRGEVIGINTAIVAPPGQGIGFAIPINMAKRVIDDLITRGRVTRPWLGVTIQDITEELAPHFDVRPGEGVLVSWVAPGSPAERAGIKEGDIIKKVDGRSVTSARRLQNEILRREVGETVKITLLRDGRRLTFYVALGEMPEEGVAKREKKEERLGITAKTLTPELARSFNLDPDDEGVVIIEVERGSPAELGGLRRGDLIKEINHNPIKDIRDFIREMDRIDLQKGVIFLIRREDHQLYLSITMG